MDTQFHSTNFIEYQERVCTEIGTKDMTPIPALKSSSQQVIAIQTDAGTICVL